PTSGCDVSSGTTIPGSTTSSSTGSTGSVSVSLIDGLQSLSHIHSRKKSPQKFPLGFRPKRYAPGVPAWPTRSPPQPPPRHARDGGLFMANTPPCDGISRAHKRGPP